MARRIRLQIFIATVTSILVAGLLSWLALANTTISQPLVGGTYREAIVGTPKNVFPLLNDSFCCGVEALLFDGLTRLGVEGLPIPALAENWSVDPQGRKYIFHLRQNAKWHDGQPFTAADVVFTLQAIQKKDFPGDPSLSALWRNVLVNQVDAHTVQFTLNVPYAPFLTATRLPILPAHLLSKIPPSQWVTSEFAQKLIGTGPFKLRQLTQERASLEANLDYFAGRPFIDKVELDFIASPPAALAKLQRQEVQAVSYDARPELNQKTLPKNLQRLQIPLDEYTVLTFNLREAPLKEQKLRQALAQSLDKATLITQALGEQAVPLESPILPGWWAYDANVPSQPYNPPGAMETLANLGYQTATGDGKGKQLRLDLLVRKEAQQLAVAQEIARQWATIGVKVEVVPLESTALRQRLRDHKFVLALQSWTRLGPDPDLFELWHSNQAATGLNYAGLHDEQVDKLLASSHIMQDLASRKEDFSAFQQRWMELVPSLTLYQPLYTFVAADNLGGLSFATPGTASAELLVGREDRYRTVSHWFVQGSRELRSTLP